MIIYKYSTDNITPNMLKGFFDGWPNPPSRTKHLEILNKSDYIVLAIDDEVNRVVGFINAISDNIMSAYIPILEVLPRYQGEGIGKELVKRMLEKLENLYMVDLICDSYLIPFYSSFGMKTGSGMMLRKYSKQNCK